MADPLTTVILEVEQPLGPGVDFERDASGRLVGRRARQGSLWLGFDRAALIESDDGSGQEVPVLVALPASTFAGCRLEARLVGGWELDGRAVLLAAVEGAEAPSQPIARAAAGLRDGAVWLDAVAAWHVVRRARQQFRDRRSHARILGGRAWRTSGGGAPESERFGTPHSATEYRLDRLPPRFVRGLEGLLDDDERLLYMVERPESSDAGVLERIRGRIDRRAALLALTDRQLLWIVDHARSDRYPSDWGVDIEVVPLERVVAVESRMTDIAVDLAVATPAGERSYRLPAELGPEVEVMRRLAARFGACQPAAPPRRIYSLEPIDFDPEPAGRFGQAIEAGLMLEQARHAGEPLAFLYSPRREGHRQPTGLSLTGDRLLFLGPAGPTAITMASVSALVLILSPLIGRLEVAAIAGRHGIVYPAPLGDQAAALVRLARRALANT